MHDAERSVFAWLRKGRQTLERCLVVINFTPKVYRDYRIKGRCGPYSLPSPTLCRGCAQAAGRGGEGQ
jgi:hypothetical protein